MDHKLLGVIAGSLVSAGTIYGVITFTHDKIQQIDEQKQEISALKEDLKQVRGNVLIDEMKGEMKWLQRRVFRIEEVYGDRLTGAPGLVREEYKQDKIDLDNLAQELKVAQRIYKALR